MAEKKLSATIQIDGTDYDVHAKTAEKLVKSLNIIHANGTTETFDGSSERTITLPTKANLGLNNVTNDAQVKRSEMGVAKGVATLNDAGKIPAEQLPSYIDDVLEYASYTNFPQSGQEKGKIYVAIDTNKTYRWSGTTYIEIGGGTGGSASGVNNATLTIQKNGTNVATFTANSAENVTANITVPTITDNLASTSATAALSANQGRILNETISSFKKITISQDDPTEGAAVDIWFKY